MVEKNKSNGVGRCVSAFQKRGKAARTNAKMERSRGGFLEGKKGALDFASGRTQELSLGRWMVAELDLMGGIQKEAGKDAEQKVRIRGLVAQKRKRHPRSSKLFEKRGELHQVILGT